MIFVFSDVHASVKKFEARIQDIQDSYGRVPDERDILVCLGDLLNAAGGEKEDKHKSKVTVNKRFLRYLEKQPYQVLSVLGNHDDTKMLYRIGYICHEEYGNEVMRVSSNVAYMHNGCVYELVDPESEQVISVLSCGGGFGHLSRFRKPGYFQSASLWKQYEDVTNRCDSNDRRTDLIDNAISYVEEMRDDESEGSDDGISDIIVYKQNDKMRVDYVLSHDAPRKKMGRIVRLIFGTTPINHVLEAVRHTVQFKHWYFGHHHFDYSVGEKFDCLYHRTACLTSDEDEKEPTA